MQATAQFRLTYLCISAGGKSVQIFKWNRYKGSKLFCIGKRLKKHDWYNADSTTAVSKSASVIYIKESLQNLNLEITWSTQETFSLKYASKTEVMQKIRSRSRAYIKEVLRSLELDSSFINDSDLLWCPGPAASSLMARSGRAILTFPGPFRPEVMLNWCPGILHNTQWRQF